MRKLRNEIDAKRIFFARPVEAKKPKVDPKNISTDMNVQPEGLMLAVRKIPSGIDVPRYPRIGIRRKFFGSAATVSNNRATATIELNILMVTIELATSGLAIQLIVQ
jgi:hypothetical protein